MANSKKALDENGVLYLWGKVKTYVATAIANIKLPSKTSDLTNDSGFITAKDVPEGAAASSTVPKMDGTAAAGTETAFARGDHVHPSDTTKVDKVEGKGLSANDYTNEEKAKLGGVEANANNYTLPDASASVKGGVTVGTNVDVSGGKISVKNGTTNQKGVVQLSSATDDTSTTKAATPSAVKAAYDLAAASRARPPLWQATALQMPTPRMRWMPRCPAPLNIRAPRTPMQTCPPPATRKAMCGTSSTPMRPTGSTPVTMWPGTAPHGMCWPVRWTCPPTCLPLTLWPSPTQSWMTSASKGGQ